MKQTDKALDKNRPGQEQGLSFWQCFARNRLYSRDLLARDFMVDYDDAGSIGKRYRRQDEIGTPLCVTVDFQTVGSETEEADHCVTVRDRDTMEQVRLPIEELRGYLAERLAY